MSVASEEHGAEHIGPIVGLDDVGREVVDETVARIHGVVHEDVDASEAVDRRLHHARQGVGVTHIGAHRERLATIGFDHRDGLVEVALRPAHQHDPGTSAGETGRHGTAESSAPSRDDRHAARDVECVPRINGHVASCHPQGWAAAS